MIFKLSYFSVPLVDGFLIWSFHLCDQLDPQHVLVECGNHFDLKVLQLALLLLDETFELFDLGHERHGAAGDLSVECFVLLL